MNEESPALEREECQDLARDVARLWRDSGGEDPDWPGVTAELEAALDRLAAAYGTTQED